MSQLELQFEQVAAERARLSRQCAAILARLKAGPATAAELIDIGFNYRARISELRKRGHRIFVAERDYKTGRTVYELQD